LNKKRKGAGWEQLGRRYEGVDGGGKKGRGGRGGGKREGGMGVGGSGGKRGVGVGGGGRE